MTTSTTPTTRESRRHKRFNVDVEAIVHSNTGPITARTRDVSRSGICLVTTLPVPMGEVLMIELVLAFGENTYSEPLKLRSRVVWCTSIMQAYQVGVMFDEISDEQDGFLEMFLHFLDGTLAPKGMTPDSASLGDSDDEIPVPPDIKDDPFRA